jgi:hypothetical protein
VKTFSIVFVGVYLLGYVCIVVLTPCAFCRIVSYFVFEDILNAGDLRKFSDFGVYVMSTNYVLLF